MSYRAFWQRRCRAAAAGAVLKPLGGNCAVLPYIPESLIPRNPENGALRMPNAFGCRFVAVHESSKENADDKIQTEQPDIRYDAFLASYTATLDMCLQGIMSPATLGIDLGCIRKVENLVYFYKHSRILR